MAWFWGISGALLVIVVAYDLLQRKHAILRNFPVIGHFRYILESIGPELRQYIVTDNDEELPFSRDQRRWVYASSKAENNYFGFGTDNEMERNSNYLIVKHSAFPLPWPGPGHPGHDNRYRIPCAKVLGGYRRRLRAFRPSSVVFISGMSYGSLSSNAIQALNEGARIAGCLHNTGEGGVSPHHDYGGELIWQIGTGYFGCRELDGRFSLQKLKDSLARYPQVRALEVKLSQGAKPGAGGILPRSKITPEIAEIRGIHTDRDCVSPSSHAAFNDVDSLLDFVEMLAAETGLPVGIKSAVGLPDFWDDLARLMDTTERAVDYIAVDGGEGGTGAGPLTFTDHVALPFKRGFAQVYRAMASRGLQDHIVFIGAGKLGLPPSALCAFALGCDMLGVAREPMMAIGCIQAQRCHTNHCPTGIATQNRWLVRGLDPTLKSARLANYILALRKELLALSRACGVAHPALVTSEHVEILDSQFGGRSLREVFGYQPNWGTPSPAARAETEELMSQLSIAVQDAATPK